MNNIRKILYWVGCALLIVLVIAFAVALIAGGPVGWIILILMLNWTGIKSSFMQPKPSYSITNQELAGNLREFSRVTREASDSLDKIFKPQVPDTFPMEWL